MIIATELVPCHNVDVGQILIVLLRGGDKSNQNRDISQRPRGSQPNGETMSKATESFSLYDTADYLTSATDDAAYLEAVLDESGDEPAVIARAFCTVAPSGNLSELAREVGMSREGLYKALSGDGNPSFATIMKWLIRSGSDSVPHGGVSITSSQVLTRVVEASQ
jgi:probable addiction module antidote protein